jgi:8-oxo-dGTP pyrophosphatase MutT (NUDIX family)
MPENAVEPNRVPQIHQHIITQGDVFDVFQPGLVRGVEVLPYSPKKKYFYVQHPEEGWRVYLRAACFLHELHRPFRSDRFLIVKRTDGDPSKASWEPPKGQMEGKDARDNKKSVLQLLKENIRREVEEEAKITHIRELTHTGLVLQSVEPDFPPNTYFHYHIFSGYAHPNQIQSAFADFAWIAEHPQEFKKFRADQREKDAIDWYTPERKMMGRWSPSLVRMYTEFFKGL